MCLCLACCVCISSYSHLMDSPFCRRDREGKGVSMFFMNGLITCRFDPFISEFLKKRWANDNYSIHIKFEQTIRLGGLQKFVHSSMLYGLITYPETPDNKSKNCALLFIYNTPYCHLQMPRQWTGKNINCPTYQAYSNIMPCLHSAKENIYRLKVKWIIKISQNMKDHI